MSSRRRKESISNPAIQKSFHNFEEFIQNFFVLLYLGKMKLIIGLFFCFILLSPVTAQTVYKTPQAAANALYSAWRVKNRAKARTAAGDKAIEKLFSTRFQPKWKFAGCNDQSETEKGLFQCIYKDASDDILSVAFDVIKTKRGWRIRWLTFGAEG